MKRPFEQVENQVVISAQDSATSAGLIPIAKQQVTAAEEALRITQENFEVGTALFLDLLQAQDAVNQAKWDSSAAGGHINVFFSFSVLAYSRQQLAISARHRG